MLTLPQVLTPSLTPHRGVVMLGWREKRVDGGGRTEEEDGGGVGVDGVEVWLHIIHYNTLHCITIHYIKLH